MIGWNPHPLMSLAILLIVHAIGLALWLWLRPRRPAPRRSSGVSVDALAAIYRRKYSDDVVRAKAEIDHPLFRSLAKAAPPIRIRAPVYNAPVPTGTIVWTTSTISHDPGDEDRS